MGVTLSQSIFIVRTGAPTLLRGTLWSEEQRADLRRRSVQIEGYGQTRPVPALDPALDGEYVW